MPRLLLTTLVALAFSTMWPAAQAATFLFGGNADGLDGVGSGSVTVDGFTMQIDAGVGVLSERDSGGLGINTRGVPAFSGGELDKFDLIQGTTPLAGQGESITFSFDQPGVITGTDFDGVKDESLEYFILTDDTGRRFEFFDSAANLSVPGAVDGAVTAGVVTGEVVFLREDGPLDDEIAGLSIPFTAGQVFTIEYQELGAPFNPLEPGNGARFQGLTVIATPEPCAFALVVAALAASARRS